MRTVICIVSLLVLSWGVPVFAQPEGSKASNCGDLQSAMNIYAAEDKEFHNQAVEKVLQYASAFHDLHKQLASLEGQKAVNLTVAISTVSGLIESLDALANFLFEKAELNAELGVEWQELIQRCQGDAGAAALEAWMATDYEILTSTAGGFFSLYSQKISEWLPEWEALQKNKSLIPSEYFLAVEEAADDMRESAKLTRSLYQNIEDSFSTLLKQH